MPNSKENIVEKCKSIFDTFGFDCKVEEAPKPKGLPLYMVQGRNFFKVVVCEIPFIVVAVAENERFSADALTRQIEKYEQAVLVSVVLFFEKTGAIQQKALIKYCIPFLSFPSVMFLPFLGIAMQKRRAKKVEASVDAQKKLMPQSQVLFLYMLYKVKSAFVSKAEAARATGLSAMAVSRCSRELESHGLVKLQERGRVVQMTCAAIGRELFEKAIPYLINPVEKTIVILGTSQNENFPKAGESALSALTMLGSPEMVTCACDKSDISSSTIDYTEDARWIYSEKLLNVQVWRYSPNPFAANGLVDPVSLYMSLKDSVDERVQASLEELMKNVKW